jgi:hypothetical protein
MTSGLHTALFIVAIILTIIANIATWVPIAAPAPAPFPGWSWRFFLLAFLFALVAFYPK